MANTMRVLAALTLVLGYVTGCASSGPGELTEETSSPRPVDPREDNAVVLAQTTPGLIVTLQLEGDSVRSLDAQVAGVSGSSTVSEDTAYITVTGIGNGDTVGRMSVADETLNVQEEVGLVTMESRTLVGTMALATRIDTLVVEAPGLAAAQEFDVGKVFDDFCEKYGNASICAKDQQQD